MIDVCIMRAFNWRKWKGNKGNKGNKGKGAGTDNMSGGDGSNDDDDGGGDGDGDSDGEVDRGSADSVSTDIVSTDLSSTSRPRLSTDARTSTSAICDATCEDDPLIRDLRERIANLTDTRPDFSEPFGT